MIARAFAVATLLLCASTGRAQYRPPPPSDAERLTEEADDLRQEAARLDAKGDRAGADRGYRRAVERYEQALAADPNGPSAVAAASGLGAACTPLREWARAQKALAPVHAAHPEAGEVSFHLAVALYKLKRYGEAVPLLDAVCADGVAAHFIAHYYRGLYALAEKDGARAVEALQRYLTLRPAELAGNDAEIQELLGRGYLLLRKPGEARAAFARAQAGRPESIAVQLGLEATLELEGKTKEAIAFLTALAPRHPTSTEIRERLGQLLLTSGELARANQVAQDLLQQRKSPATWRLLGDVRLAQKQAKGAEQAYREALKLQPELVAAQVSLARALELQGRNAEAVDLLDGAVKARPDDLMVRAALGSAYRRAGRFQQAVAVHQDLLTRAPKSPLGLEGLGADHFATGQWDEAIHDYGELLKSEPNLPGARHWLALALARRAQVRVKANLLDDAALDLRRAFDFDRTPPIGQALASVLLTQKRYLEAQTALQSIATPGWRDDWLLGYALLGEGDAKSALAAFERSERHAPDGAARSDAYLGWALAKLELGDYETAASKLGGGSESEAALRVMQANLPLALLRLGFHRLDENDVPGALKALEMASALPEVKHAPASSIAELLRGLVAIDKGQWAQAESSIAAALAKKEPWFEPHARPLLTAYLEYRRGRLKEARRALALAQKQPGIDKLPWAQELARAFNRREAEQLYAQGALPRAEQLWKALAAADPLNAVVANDLACVHYRRGMIDDAVQTFRRIADAVPEAQLNLGIFAQYKQKDPRSAVAFYEKYVAGGGPRAAMVKEWVDRLQRLHGLDTSSAARSNK